MLAVMVEDRIRESVQGLSSLLPELPPCVHQPRFSEEGERKEKKRGVREGGGEVKGGEEEGGASR